MSLEFQALNADFAVAPQLDASDMSEAAKAGFRSVINNRPDGEGGPDQPLNAAGCRPGSRATRSRPPARISSPASSS